MIYLMNVVEGNNVYDKLVEKLNELFEYEE